MSTEITLTTTQERKPPKHLICLRDLSNYRDSTMPDSPDAKVSATAVSPVSSMPPVTARPLSTSSSLSGMNGAHSPHSSLSGRTPSPPSLGGSAGQQLPPACGARQLSKLKRFLTTLQQFGSDISPEIGERVRSLVLGLVNSHLSIEEFHAKLQEATNFPLRPFVIPFLKANLPLLQRELLHCARLAKQTPQQYLAHNEHVLFDAAHSPLDPQDLNPDFNENGKRRSPDRPKENGVDAHLDALHPAKRPHTMSPAGSAAPTRVSPSGPSSYNYHVGPIRLEDISINREMRERERLERERTERERAERERERERQYSSGYNFHRAEHFENLERIEDDWKHVENMLHCIMGMVDKCKRVLTVLQERSQHDREELAMWMRRHPDDVDIKKRSSADMMLRQTEDRVTEVKRRAEEAVNEVKRQAVAELQKAVTAAESKASEMVTAERAKMEQAIAEARKQARDEVSTTINTQEESIESCWNCGRKASETCSGCNVARYCGSFCQHKDWENHHRVCGQTLGATREQQLQASKERMAQEAREARDRGSPPSSIPTPLALSQAPLSSSSLSSSSSAATSAPIASTAASLSVTIASPSAISGARVVPSPTGSSTGSNSQSGSRSSTPAEGKPDASR